MTKQEALDLFGGKHKALAEALGISRQAVYKWPAELSKRQSMAVMGAKHRQLADEHKRLDALK